MINEFRISMPPAVFEKIRGEAEAKGLSANMLARMELCRLYGKAEVSGAKTFSVTLEDWQEIEAFAKAKKYGSVENLIAIAIEQAMSRHPLTAAQKARAERFIGK